MTEHRDGDLVFGLDGTAVPQRSVREPARRPRSQRRQLAIALVLAVLVVAAGLAAYALGHRAPTVVPARAAVATTFPRAGTSSSARPTPATASTPTTTPWASATAYRTLPPQQVAAETAELHKTAATLTSPVRLTSPTLWDQWLPQGKDYQAESQEEDIATCPRIAARLSQALGVPMSYWIGTLPMGPNGCDWADEPLTYDNPSRYAYVLSIGFLDDGTTTETWRHHFYEQQGAICPDVDVPAVAPHAVLVRCSDPGTDEGYTLVLPDTRTGGLWFVGAEVRPNATRPPAAAFRALLDATVGAFGG